jgi:hypothetical protein
MRTFDHTGLIQNINANLAPLRKGTARRSAEKRGHQGMAHVTRWLGQHI